MKSTLLRLPFMELYCRIRYRKSWLAHMQDEIDEMLKKLGDFFQ